MITFTVLILSENDLSLNGSPDHHRRIVPTPLVSIITKGAEGQSKKVYTPL